MTYCLAAIVDEGLVFASDSRTNAGIDQLGVYSKMHFFDLPDDRYFVLLSAGNLATTQAVVAALRRDLREGNEQSLGTFERMREAAQYIGEISVAVQDRYRESDGESGFNGEANFIFGGQIAGQPPALFHIYPQGNFVAPNRSTPFLLIGEQKYGKPILDRIVHPEAPLATVLRCALLSMDSTMRSNAGVGPPIEMLVRPDAGAPQHYVFEDGDPYLQSMRESWETSLRAAVDLLPEPVPTTVRTNLKVVD